jgi:hypothetical protein
MQKATVIFKNENENKSLILEISHNEENGDVNVQLKAEPSQSIRKLIETEEFYVQLFAILIDELGDVDEIIPK